MIVEPRREAIPDAHVWWRIADPAWLDPLDPGYARDRGGRWNPPDSFPVLYLNEDMVTARLNLRAFIADSVWTAYEPEEIRDDHGPLLIGCTLPRGQVVCDAHSQAGIRAVGLPDSYPLERDGTRVPRERCQSIGALAKAAGLHGVRARSARSADGAGRELAWFPASGQRAQIVHRLTFTAWFWG